MNTGDVLLEVASERARQEELQRSGRFPWTCARVYAPYSNAPGIHFEQGERIPQPAKLAVLAEEFGEVARAVCECDMKNLREELIQVAAVAVAWAESMDP